MERGLHDRDRVGLQDQVLLEEFQSEDAFVENLRKRFQEDLIYVSFIENIIKKFIYFLKILSILDLYWTSPNFHQPVQGAGHLF